MTKMNCKIKIVAAVLMSICTLSTASAQKSGADSTKQKSAPKKVVMTPAQELEKLQDSLAKYEALRDKLQVDIEKAKVEAEKVKKFTQINLDSLLFTPYREVDKGNTEVEKVKKELGEVANRHKEALSTREKLNVYAEIRKENRFKYNLQLLERKFSALSDNDIAYLQASVSTYADKWSYKQKVDTLHENWKIYSKSVKMLATPFDPNAINKLRERTYALVCYYNNKSQANTLNAEQFKEIDSLDISLSRYKNGVIELHKLVEKANANVEVKKLREEKNSEECIKKIKSIVERNEGNEAIYKRYFSRLPYLTKMIKDYIKEIEQDPITTPTKTEQEIKKLCSKIP
jgi:hypothetical protein